MAESISQRTTVATVDGGRGENELDAPFAMPNQASNPRRASSLGTALVVASLVAPIVGGPLGSVVAIVFGWSARWEIQESSTRLQRLLAVVGVGLGFVFTSIWAAAIAHVALTLEKNARGLSEGAYVATDVSSPVNNVVAHAATDPTSRESLLHAPTKTVTRREGLIVVVDVGTLVPSLAEEVAKERFEAARVGDRIVVMTTRVECSSCRFFVNNLRHPMMQTALAHVRLVRIDADAFEEDLSALKVPRERLPGFFLLAPDLFPVDGIDVGEWKSDQVSNIAPVVGAFVHGRYATRQRTWHSASENRIRL